MSFRSCEFKELSECIDLIIDHRGKTPKKMGGDWVDSGIKTISAKNVHNGELTHIEDIRYVEEEVYKKWMKDDVRRGDCFIVSEGATLGESLYWDIDEKIVLGQRLFCIRTNNKILDSKYFSAYIRTREYQKEIDAASTGTSVLGMRQSALLKTKVLVPNIFEQRYIGNVYYSINKKNNVNNKINKTLEKMAQTIFKQWFVDFEFPNQDGEPYKSSGGEMIQSELGDIPKGWEIGSFKEYIETILGGDWGKESLQDNYTKEVYCLRGADIPEVREGRKGKLPKRYIIEKNYKNKKLKSGDLVVEISGGSPTQSTGRITYITNEILAKYDCDFVCTNFCRAITLTDKEAMEYFFFNWHYLYNQNVFFLYENGTTGIKNFDINTFIENYKIVKPNKDILMKFSKIANNLIKMIQVNGDENIKLSEIRDSLLPKLISGEIRVPLESEGDVS